MEIHFITNEYYKKIFNLGFRSEGFENRDTARTGFLKTEFFKWVRDNHKIFCSINVDQTMEPKFCYSISKYISNDLINDWVNIVNNSDLYRTYEDAEDACINEVVQLLSNNKQNIKDESFYIRESFNEEQIKNMWDSTIPKINKDENNNSKGVL